MTAKVERTPTCPLSAQVSVASSLILARIVKGARIIVRNAGGGGCAGGTGGTVGVWTIRLTSRVAVVRCDAVLAERTRIRQAWIYIHVCNTRTCLMILITDWSYEIMKRYTVDYRKNPQKTIITVVRYKCDVCINIKNCGCQYNIHTALWKNHNALLKAASNPILHSCTCYVIIGRQRPHRVHAIWPKNFVLNQPIPCIQSSWVS